MRLVIFYLTAFFSVGWPAVVYAQPAPASPTTPTTSTPAATPDKIGTFTIGDGTTIGGVNEGDQAQGLKVLPPWTMRKCPKSFYATYDSAGAKQLKLTDNDCHLWQVQQTELSKQVTAKDAMITTLKAVNDEHEAAHKRDDARIQELTKQLKDEIAEKNEYKYKPNTGWLYIAIGAAVAVLGAGFGIGAIVASKD